MIPITLSGAQIFDALARHVREDQIVLDLVSIPPHPGLRGDVVGLCW